MCMEISMTAGLCEIHGDGVGETLSFHRQPHRVVGGNADKDTGDWGDFKDSVTSPNDPM